VRLRVASARALGRVGTLEAKAALMRCLGDTGEDVRLAAMEALGSMPGNDVLQALLGMCQDPSRKVRLALARVAGTLRQVGAVDLGESLGRDPDEGVRREALLSLLALRDTEAMERFLASFSGQEPEVKLALQALLDGWRGFSQEMVFLQDLISIGVGRWIGYGRAGGDHIQRVADHVRQDQRGQGGLPHPAGDLAPFELLEMLAQGIDLVHRGAAGQQGGGERLQFGEG
jgi:hypothetical protein